MYRIRITVAEWKKEIRVRTPVQRERNWGMNERNQTNKIRIYPFSRTNDIRWCHSGFNTAAYCPSGPTFRHLCVCSVIQVIHIVAYHVPPRMALFMNSVHLMHNLDVLYIGPRASSNATFLYAHRTAGIIRKIKNIQFQYPMPQYFRGQKENPSKRAQESHADRNWHIAQYS